jgi:ABC-type transport system involved in multi-copper enzyme maturation permease subunit
MRAGRNALIATALYFVVLELMLVPAILYWPRFSEHIPAIRGLMPLPFAQKLMDVIDQAGVEPYVILQQYFKACNILGAAAAVLFAVSSVAGEAHRGTLEIVLARPLSRRHVLFERWAAGALQVSVPVFLTSATIPWLLSLVDESMSMRTLMLCSAHESLFLLALFSLTFFFSAVGRNPVRIAVGVLFLSIFEFSIYVIERVTHWSLFRLADVEVFLAIDRRGALDPKLVLPLAGISLAFLVASLFAFERRTP